MSRHRTATSPESPTSRLLRFLAALPDLLEDILVEVLDEWTRRIQDGTPVMVEVDCTIELGRALRIPPEFVESYIVELLDRPDRATHDDWESARAQLRSVALVVDRIDATRGARRRRAHGR